jgi:hypothetical protein
MPTLLPMSFVNAVVVVVVAAVVVVSFSLLDFFRFFRWLSLTASHARR